MQQITQTYSTMTDQEQNTQMTDDASPTVLAGTNPDPKAPNGKTPKEGKKSNKTLVWTLVILLLLAALGGGGYYLYSNGTFDDLLGKTHKKTVVDDEDEADWDDEDEDDEWADEDEDDDWADEDDTDEWDDPDDEDPIEAYVDDDSNTTPPSADTTATTPRQDTRPTTPAPPAGQRPTPPTQQRPTQPVQQTPTQPVQQRPTQPVQQTPTQPVQQTPPPTRINPTPPQPSVTMVTVTTNIPRAMVIVDGQDVGWAPWSGELTPGMHTFALKAKNKEKFRTSDFAVSVSGSSKTIPINVPDPSVFD